MMPGGADNIIRNKEWPQSSEHPALQSQQENIKHIQNYSTESSMCDLKLFHFGKIMPISYRIHPGSPQPFITLFITFLAHLI